MSQSTLVRDKSNSVLTLSVKDLFGFPIIPEAAECPLLDWDNRLVKPFPSTPTFGSIVKKVLAQSSDYVLKADILERRPETEDDLMFFDLFPDLFPKREFDHLRKFKLFACLVNKGRVCAKTGLIGPDSDLLIRFAKDYGMKLV